MSVRPGRSNRRKFPRFTPRYPIFVYHNTLGRVVDIGVGGMNYVYCAGEIVPGKLPDSGCLICGSDLLIADIQFETVCDRQAPDHLDPEFDRARQRSVKFGELSPRQLQDLERFILRCAEVTTAQ